MMKEVITYKDINNYKKDLIDISRKHILSKAALIQIILYVLIAVIFLYSGISSGYDFKKVTYENIENVSLYNYNIHIGLGIGLIVFSLFLILSYIKSKNQIQLINNSIYAKYSSEFTYEFKEQGLTFTNLFKLETKKWELYSKFKVLENYILLYSKNEIDKLPIDIIPSDVLDNERKERIIEILKSKIN